MIKNIILDVGKVLVAWEPRIAMQKLGFDEKTADIVAKATAEAAEWAETDRGAKSDEELLASFVANAPDYEREINMFWEHVDEAIWQFDYTKAWIGRFKELGYHVYILSNYGSWTYGKTQEALSFLTDVDGALFSYEVKQVKPEPEIYQALLKRFDLNAEECIFLDDCQENIDGARAQGIEGIRFLGYEDAKEKLRAFGIDV